MELHFSDQKWIYGAFPKFYQYSGHFLNLGRKKALPGTRGALAEGPGGLSVRGSRAGGTRRVPGGVLGARLTRRAPGRGSRGSATRDTWPAREHPGVLPAGYSGTRVVLAGLPDVVYGLGTRGQVAFSVTSGGSLSRGTRGQVSHSEASGEVSLAVHSGTSG